MIERLRLKPEHIQKPRFNLQLIGSVVLVAIMVMLRDLGVFHFSPVCFLAVVVLISVLLPISSLRPFVFFYITAGLSVHGATLIPLAIALVAKTRKYSLAQFVFPILMLLLELAHILSYDFKTEIPDFVVYALNIFIFFFLLFDTGDEHDDVKDCIRYYIFGVVTATSIVFLHSLSVLGLQGMLYENFRMGATFEDKQRLGEMITSMNPNQMAFYSLAAFSLILFIKDLYKSQIIKSAQIAILLIVGLFTMSRTWILLLILTLVSYFLISEMKGKFKLLMTVVVFVLVGLRFTDFSEVIIENFQSRFEESSLMSAGRRVEILKEYNEWMLNHPNRNFVGTGALYYSKVCGLKYSVHNSIQQIFVSYGMFGILFFALFIAFYCYRCHWRNKAVFRYYMPLMICFLFSLSGQLLNPVSMLLPFAAVALPLKLFTSKAL